MSETAVNISAWLIQLMGTRPCNGYPPNSYVTALPETLLGLLSDAFWAHHADGVVLVSLASVTLALHAISPFHTRRQSNDCRIGYWASRAGHGLLLARWSIGPLFG